MKGREGVRSLAGRDRFVFGQRRLPSSFRVFFPCFCVAFLLFPLSRMTRACHVVPSITGPFEKLITRLLCSGAGLRRELTRLMTSRDPALFPAGRAPEGPRIAIENIFPRSRRANINHDLRDARSERVLSNVHPPEAEVSMCRFLRRLE